MRDKLSLNGKLDLHQYNYTLLGSSIENMKKMNYLETAGAKVIKSKYSSNENSVRNN